MRFLPLWTALLLGSAVGWASSAQAQTPAAVVMASGGSAASSPVVASPASPSPASPLWTVTVQAGDTAYSLARRAGLSVEVLLSLNSLSLNGAGGVDLKVGQVLRVRDVPAHVVQPGETLYALSRHYGISVQSLLSANGLPEGAVLRVGQSLRIAPVVAGAVGLPVSTTAPVVGSVAGPVIGSAAGLLTAVATTPVTTTLAGTPTPAAVSARVPLPAASGPSLTAQAVSVSSPFSGAGLDWRSAALGLLGTPYVFGGANRSGTDCSGFVLQVFSPLGLSLPRRSADQAQVGQPVDAAALLPGDLVFFDTEGRGAVTHVGIYLGDDSFVNANSYKGAVTVDRLMADRYWAPRYLGARRVMGTPVASLP